MAEQTDKSVFYRTIDTTQPEKTPVFPLWEGRRFQICISSFE
jgi:hypothetical protein